MCMVDDADDDTWVTLGDTHPKARKQHHCGECGRRIEPGETYRRWRGHSNDYGFSQGTMCAQCDHACRWLGVVCGGALFGAVVEDLCEHWDNRESVISWPFLRLVAGSQRRWLRKDGSRIPVERVAVWTDAAITAYEAHYAEAVA